MYDFWLHLVDLQKIKIKGMIRLPTITNEFKKLKFLKEVGVIINRSLFINRCFQPTIANRPGGAHVLFMYLF